MATYTHTYSDNFGRVDLGPWAVDDGSVQIYANALHTDLHHNSTARYLRPDADRSQWFLFATQRAELIGIGAEGVPQGNEVWALQFFGQGSSDSGPLGWLDARFYLDGGYLMLAEQNGNIAGAPLFATEQGFVNAEEIIGASGVVMEAIVQPAGPGELLFHVELRPPIGTTYALEQTITPSVAIDTSEVFMRFRSHNGAGISDWSGLVAYQDKPIQIGPPEE